MIMLFGDFNNFMAQLIFITAFMIYGLMICGKKSQSKHNYHVINLNQSSSRKQIPSSKKSQSHHSRSRTRSRHSRSRSKHANNYDNKSNDRRHRKKKEEEEMAGEEKNSEKQQKQKAQEKQIEAIPESEYPDIPEPTESAKKRREKEIAREKRQRIKEGFYQERSDEDDTLEPIRSLKEEYTDNSTKKSNKKNTKR